MYKKILFFLRSHQIYDVWKVLDQCFEEYKEQQIAANGGGDDFDPTEIVPLLPDQTTDNSCSTESKDDVDEDRVISIGIFFFMWCILIQNNIKAKLNIVSG